MSSSSSAAAAAAAAKSATAIGNIMWQKQPKVNAELFALTYGALMGELLRDLEKADLIGSEIDRMGHSIGLRSGEEFLAKATNSSETQVQIGGSFEETPDVMKMILRMFLGIHADSRWKQSNTSSSANPSTPTAASASDASTPTAPASSSSSTTTSYSLIFTENPLTLFVELPDDLAETLEYNQLLAGWCRGVLELLQFDCTCTIEQSVLQGDGMNEISISLNQVLQDGAGEDYQEE